MNEGFLGRFTFNGERVATDDHPVILHALPLAASVTAAIPAGTLLKQVADTVTAAVTETAAVTVGIGNTGISAATVTAATFKSKVSNVAGTYAFSYDSAAWKLAGQTVTIADYGLTLTGSAASGDTLSVVFTASVPAVTAQNYAPLLTTDSGVDPVAVADVPCDPTDTHGERSVIAVVHGTVKTRMLSLSGGTAASEMNIVKLREHGIFAV